METSTHYCYNKRWNKIFEKDRDFKEDTPWVEEMEKLEAGDDEDIGLARPQPLISERLCLYGEVESYCHGAQIEEVTVGIGTAGQRRAAWLDDREFRRPEPRRPGLSFSRRLTATELFKELKKKVSY